MRLMPDGSPSRRSSPPQQDEQASIAETPAFIGKVA